MGNSHLRIRYLASSRRGRSYDWPQARLNQTRTTATVGAAASVPIEPKVVTTKKEMSPKFWVEAQSSGKPHFVKIKRSRSHHHHHDRHHHHHGHRHHKRRHSHWDEEYCPPQYYTVSREEWDVLKERERLLNENNKVLAEENKCLRGDLAAAQDEVQRLTQCVVPEIQARNDALYAENAGLRRSLDKAADDAAKHHIELDRLQCRIDKLERDCKKFEGDNCDLRSRVKSLTRQLDDRCNRRIEDLMREVKYWRNKFLDLEEVLDLRTQRMKAYEDIMRCRGIRF